MNSLEIRTARAVAASLGHPLAGYSTRQITEAFAALPERTRTAIATAPVHIRAFILETRLAKLGFKPEPEIVVPAAPAPGAVDLAARLSVLQSL